MGGAPATLDFTVNPPSINETLNTDGTVDINVIITNTGEATFDYTIENNMGGMVQFEYDVTTASGGTVNQAGVECDGSFIYTTVWNTSDILKFDMSGNYIETFQISGVTGLRDLAYDGTYFYGADATAKIWEMDFTAKTLISEITYTGDGTRAIAYDEENDAFWVNNWSTDMRLIDRSGAQLSSITGIESTYGAAYDNISTGGPYLWIHTGTDDTNPVEIVQYEIATGTKTGTRYNSYVSDTASAGGLFLSDGFVAGEYTLGALAQGEAIYGIGLSNHSYWGSTTNGTGSIVVGGTDNITVNLDAAGLAEVVKNGKITITANSAKAQKIVEIPVTLTVAGASSITEGLIPNTTTLNQNYPNPFNPITTIKFFNKVSGKVKLTVYNVKGELVSTLVNDKFANTGFSTIKFDASSFNSGVYYYKLETTERTLTKKMILVK